MKSLADKIHLKERLYTIWMPECTPIQTRLDKFNSILIDLATLRLKLNMRVRLFVGCLFAHTL